MFAFYFSRYNSGCLWGRFGMGPVFTTVSRTNILPLAPGTKRGAWGHNRGHFGGGPALARLCPLHFLFNRSGRRLRCRIQHQLWPGSLALQERVASGRAGALSRLRLLRRLSRCRCRFRWLLCWCRSGATDGCCRAGRLGRKFRIAWDDFCAAVKRSANPSTPGPNSPIGGDRRVEEGDLVSLLNFSEV